MVEHAGYDLKLKIIAKTKWQSLFHRDKAHMLPVFSISLSEEIFFWGGAHLTVLRGYFWL